MNVTKKTFFDKRFLIDHHNLRHLNTVTRDPDNVDTELLRKDTDRAKANMDRGAEYGFNGYVFFSQSFEELVSYDFAVTGFSGEVYPKDHPHRTAAAMCSEYINEAAEYGRSLGLDVIWHVNQFAFAPEAYAAFGERMAGTSRVCPGKEISWELLRGKIREFFTKHPAVSGLQITTSETQVSATSCKCPDCSDMNDVDRFGRMAKKAWSACSAMGKILQFRTWGEIMGWHGEYERMVSGLPEGIVMSTKNTLGDFHLSDPPSHLIGAGDRTQVIEFDSWGEYYGWNQFPCYMGEAFSERLRICADRGVAQVATRINWEPRANFIFDHPYCNEVNVFAFSKLCEDPYRDPDDVLAEWLSSRFPDSAIPKAMDFYKLTYQAQYTWLDFKDFNCNDHSRVYQLMGRPTYRERLDFQVGELAAAGYTFDPASISAQRESIVSRFDECAKALADLKAFIPDAEYAYMEHNVTNQLYCALTIADCLEMYGYMLALDRGEKLPDLSAFERDTKQRLGGWEKHDAWSYGLMNGPNAVAVFEELERLRCRVS